MTRLDRIKDQWRHLARMRVWANIVAALVLFWASGQFTHAHEFAPHITSAELAGVAAAHKTGAGAPAHVHAPSLHTEASEGENLHCGVPLLAAQPQDPVWLGEQAHPRFASAAAQRRLDVCAYDPPPPRT